MDIVTPEKRSANMQAIRRTNTRPEKLVRSVLHAMGLRFRLHTARLPGSPDIVLPKWNSVILVHGCFWHRHPGCRFSYTPKSNRAFWNRKFRVNVARDELALAALQELGWTVHIVWECETKDRTGLERRLGGLFRPGK